MKKRPQNRLPKCLKPKKQTPSLKKQFCFKKTYKFIWKKATGPSSKMPEAKKQHFHWKKHSVPKKLINSYEKRLENRLPICLKPKKTTLSLKNNSVPKKLINSYEKMPQNRLPKCLKPKKTTLSLKKQFCFKKAYRFIWKKFTEPSSKMPEAKRKNTLIEKTILFQKKLIISYEKMPQNRLTKCLKQKTYTHWKNNSVSKKLINSYDKNATEPSYNIEKTILFQKNLWIHMKKRPQNRLPKCLKPKKQTLSLKKQFCFKKTYKFIWKKATEPYSKMPEAKNNNTFLTKTVCSKQNL